MGLCTFCGATSDVTLSANAGIDTCIDCIATIGDPPEYLPTSRCTLFSMLHTLAAHGNSAACRENIDALITRLNSLSISDFEQFLAVSCMHADIAQLVMEILNKTGA